jgi:Mrp family chromosome partitioning ATPase
MPAGPFLPGLPELLNSTNVQKFIEILEESEMDFVIFDAETLVSAVYPNILASKVDGVLVVVDVKNTDKSHLEQMRALLVRTKANVIGCIANKQYYNPKATTVYYPTGTESHENVVVDNLYPDRLGIADRITAKLRNFSLQRNSR